MLEFTLILLVVLWLFGYLSFPLTTFQLFVLGNRVITLNDLLIFAVIVWLLGLLPSPFRGIAFVLFLFWILGSVGIISLTGFSSLVLVALIVGLVAYIARERHYW